MTITLDQYLSTVKRHELAAVVDNITTTIAWWGGRRIHLEPYTGSISLWRFLDMGFPGVPGPGATAQDRANRKLNYNSLQRLDSRKRHLCYLSIQEEENIGIITYIFAKVIDFPYCFWGFDIDFAFTGGK